MNHFRTQNGKKNASFLGVRFADGSGSNIIEYCKGFKKSGFDVCLFCDSDDSGINSKKDSFKETGISVIDCEQENSFENQVFKDLPWDAIWELIIYKEEELSEMSIKDNVNNEYSGTLSANWKKTDLPEIREALGNAAKNKKNGWFKRIDSGEFLGTVILKYFEQIQDKKLGKQLEKLSEWIDNDRL